MARTLIRAETQLNNDSSTGTNYFLKTDGTTALEADLDAATFTITNLATPSAADDAASKTYVDSVAQGLDIKESVRVTTDSTSVDLASATDPGAIDGVTLANGDRILLKDQTTASENGIYDAVTAADPTTWTRSDDADSDTKVNPGMFMFVEEGTANGDTGWVLVTDDPITLNTTDLSFSQFTGAGQISAGDGLQKTGDTIDFVAADSSLTVTATDAAVNAGNGLTVGTDLAVQNADGSISVAAGGISVALDATAGTISLGGAGLQVSDADAGQFLVGQGTGTDTTFVTLSGDVASVSAAGAVTLSSDFVKGADYTRDSFSGDDVTTSFTLAATPVTDSELVYVNGQFLKKGVGNDYTITGTSLDFEWTPKTGDVIEVVYIQ